jgi:hypothetical protein
MFAIFPDRRYLDLIFRVHIQKGLIFDLKRENKFLPKDI